MDVRIREVPDDLHMEFKLLCVKQKISMNQKLIAMIREEVKKAQEAGTKK